MNIQPFNNLTSINHFNTGLLQYSNPLCILFKSVPGCLSVTNVLSNKINNLNKSNNKMCVGNANSHFIDDKYLSCYMCQYVLVVQFIIFFIKESTHVKVLFLMFTLHFLLKANIEKLLSSKPRCLIYSEDRTSNGRKRRKTNNGEIRRRITAHSSESTS